MMEKNEQSYVLAFNSLHMIQYYFVYITDIRSYYGVKYLVLYSFNTV